MYWRNTLSRTTASYPIIYSTLSVLLPLVLASSLTLLSSVFYPLSLLSFVFPSLPFFLLRVSFSSPPPPPSLLSPSCFVPLFLHYNHLAFPRFPFVLFPLSLVH